MPHLGFPISPISPPFFVRSLPNSFPNSLRKTAMSPDLPAISPPELPLSYSPSALRRAALGGGLRAEVLSMRC